MPPALPVDTAGGVWCSRLFLHQFWGRGSEISMKPLQWCPRSCRCLHHHHAWGITTFHFCPFHEKSNGKEEASLPLLRSSRGQLKRSLGPKGVRQRQRQRHPPMTSQCLSAIPCVVILFSGLLEWQKQKPDSLEVRDIHSWVHHCLGSDSKSVHPTLQREAVTSK